MEGSQTAITALAQERGPLKAVTCRCFSNGMILDRWQLALSFPPYLKLLLPIQPSHKVSCPSCKPVGMPESKSMEKSKDAENRMSKLRCQILLEWLCDLHQT